MTTKRVDYWSPSANAPDAIEDAKAAAHDEGFAVRTVALVKWEPRENRTGWRVTLVLRVPEA